MNYRGGLHVLLIFVDIEQERGALSDVVSPVNRDSFGGLVFRWNSWNKPSGAYNRYDVRSILKYASGHC